MINLSPLKSQILGASRRLLHEQNRDPYAPTYGCFDRRYWGWKLTDFPEATFQRNVYPLAWLAQDGPAAADLPPALLSECARAGLSFAVRWQHADGSFDQAFPHEHSFGATAFLTQPLLEAYQLVRADGSAAWRTEIEAGLWRAAEFLVRRAETHGFIANHLAGAVTALWAAARFFAEPRFEARGQALLNYLLEHQSPEGWFPEYEGADPGYQTLCLHYLAQAYRWRPEPRLRQALGRAVEFLAWFAHPDGSFGGEYGSRRTNIYYPGGVALLSREFPLAASLTRTMLQGLVQRRTPAAVEIDMGNLAPLLSSYVLALQAEESQEPAVPLPSEVGVAGLQDFPEAGLYVRRTARYYAVFGASNGGVLKVFERGSGRLLWNDAGYAGQLTDGRPITTQMTGPGRLRRAAAERIEIETAFYRQLDAVPTPWAFLLLRALNLTLMRNVWLGNWIKAQLVKLLISGKQTVPLRLTRQVRFEPERVVVTDRLTVQGRLALRWLEFGRPFVGIHMASARYFDAGALAGRPRRVDVDRLTQTGALEVETVI